MSKAVLDYGLVKTAKTLPDGSISFYGRVAVANRPYKYANRDGSIRNELITREQLFDGDSTATLKIQTITHPHAPEDLTPDNYSQYVVGSTGNLVIAGLDGDYLGVVGCIKRRDAINAFNSGIRELSPGYMRSLTKSKDKFYQTDRRYFELSLVDRARGGQDIKIKDSLDLDIDKFCADQIDEDLMNFWMCDGGLQNDAIDRLLTYGNLSPPSIELRSKDIEPIIHEKQIMQKVKIGDVILQVDDTCADAAIELSAEFSLLKTKAETVEKTITDSIDDKAKISALEMKATDLSQKLTDSISNKRAELVEEVRKLQTAANEIKTFAAAGHNVDAAKKALDSFDVDTYQQAIVKTVAKDEVSKDLVSVYYKAHLDALTKHGFANQDELYNQPNGMTRGASNGTIGNFLIPNQLQQLSGYGGNSLGNQAIASEAVGGLSGEMDIIMGRSGVTGGKPADTAENGWY
jgi:hypothetical protein